jgi:hypothetical protein
MSIAPVSTNNFINTASQASHNNLKQFQQEFQQLGSDLQSGNITAAQQDFAALGVSPATTAKATNPVLQQFQQLGQALQSGNTSAAKQDYSKVKQDISKVDRTHNHHQFHIQFHIKDGSDASQSFSELGQALQSGNASLAQSSYNSLFQDFSSIGQSIDPAAALGAPGATGVSVNA